MSNSEKHVITANALTEKRAELLFEITEGEKRLDRLRTVPTKNDVSFRSIISRSNRSRNFSSQFEP